MRSRVRNCVLGATVLCLAVLAVGCPNSTPVSPGNATLLVDIQVSNTTTRFVGLFQIDQISIRPTDPDANAALGNRALSLLRGPLFIDLEDPVVDPLFLAPSPLAEGSYVVTALRMSSFNLIDEDFITDPATCNDYQFSYTTNPSTSIDITTFAVPPTFTVTRDMANPLVVNLDLGQMISSFQNAWVCVAGCGLWCPASNFSAATFASANGSYLSFD